MAQQEDAAVLATVWRGSACEAKVRGQIAVLAADGDTAGSIGNPGALTTLRSAVKPIQAMPLAAAAEKLNLPDDELAIACGSHSAQPEHVATVRRLLARVGLDESLLSCGPQLPTDRKESAKRILSGEPLRPIDNNCSGKHSGMLAACVANGWSTTDYAAADHPLQRLIDGHLARLSGCDVGASPRGTDGCGLPTHALPLSGLARAFSAGQSDPLFARCQGAMAAHPLMVGGEGRFDTAVLAAAGDTLVVKGGAYAVWVAAQRGGGPAVAIKLESGWAEPMPAIACAALLRFGLLTSLPQPLERFSDTRVRNWAGTVVGEIRIEF